MYLPFEKWHGAKNDFIIIWLTDADGELVFDSLKRQSIALCSKDGSGIGADGILVLHTKKPSDLNPYRLSIINSDGSLANTCGNGIRCSALSIRKRHLEKGNPKELPDAVSFEVSGKEVDCHFSLKSKGHAWPFVMVEMGVPRINSDVSFFKEATQEIERAAKDLNLPALKDDYSVVDIGNPHLVFMLSSADRDLLHKVGPFFQKSAYWDGINVHLVTQQSISTPDQSFALSLLGGRLGEKFKALVWERGAGETKACGSGACAIAASSFASGLISREEWIGVEMPGGSLYIKQENEDDPMTLAGPGEFVFSGNIEI